MGAEESSGRSAPAPSVELVATYRLQLGAELTFDRAAALCPYLRALGVSHVYLSPVLQARKGSAHGYDGTDPTAIDVERGGREGFERLVASARAHGLGIVLDIVPNHLAASVENPWWRDVLRHGRASESAAVFDVEWSDEPLVLPLLERPLDLLCAEAAIAPARRDGELVLAVAGMELPLAPATTESVLARAVRRERRAEERESSSAQRERGAARDERDGVARREAQLPPRWWESAPLRAAVDAELDALARDARELRAILRAQAYRLGCWRDAAREVGYRRFFNVSELVGVRVEDPAVHERTHGLVTTLVRAGAVDGLRVDHVDGLRDPAAYLARLRADVGDAPIWVEKILAPDESLPTDWPVEGTTGYELARVVDGVLVDPSGEEPLTRLHAQHTGERRAFAAIAREARLEVIDAMFARDLERLAARLERAGAELGWPPPRRAARELLRALLASFPVYRTYVRSGNEPTDADRRSIDAAFAAVRADPAADARLAERARALFLQRERGAAAEEFVARFQQLCTATYAKGVEDTAFYRYHRLVALNEVGGDPGTFGVPLASFHRFLADVQREHPLTLLGSSTHDSKRGEDVRARLLALSEHPERWAALVARWHERHGALFPDPGIEYLAYQTIVGAFPLEAERARAVLLKSAREAALATSWIAPDERYEAALERALERVLADAAVAADARAFLAAIGPAARANALAALVVKLTAPGVPDVYQGAELEHLRLVDPDNRAPVDFARREALLRELDAHAPTAPLACGDLGCAKLWLIQRALRVRRSRPAAFDARGAYRPLLAEGAGADRVIAFARGEEVVTIASRFAARSTEGWGDTTLALPEGQGGTWRDELTGREHAGRARLAALLTEHPIALLLRGEART